MTDFPAALQLFFNKQRHRYGEFFWFQEMTTCGERSRTTCGERSRTTKSGEKLLVFMAEKLAQVARDIVNAPETKYDGTIISFERDERIGDFYAVMHDSKFILNMPSRQEYEAITDEKLESVLPVNTNNELIRDELVRVFQPKGFSQYAAVAYHSFGFHAPRILGWFENISGLRVLQHKQFLRSMIVSDFKKACSELEGVPYTLGGKSRGHGFDCSGLVQRVVFETKNIWLPRKAMWQAMVCEPIEQSDIQKTDLVFFTKKCETTTCGERSRTTCGERSRTINHVALVYEPQQGKLPIIFHAKKNIGKVAFEDLNTASWLGGWKIAGYGRIDESCLTR
ncbi:MAG: hypothetical protein COZ64_00210 [Candidatus Brennerbacteria bacterium CG_4_8_14_3_um_filter_43_14]|uniref:NlpC/P60 domain-containing protein n=1 Tax=Candidatus Brennerbacteria bacterium CG_4_8_14_3_um_filter_43_14 TaxID=1974521 RepID=A0A2H9N7H4_9BACT|nr:MAG: hypothetical protein COZ64_00210 [Candidatus Brennerbacteria bacterium CG_4_8_14_3_um_filter_43_14]